MKKIILTLMLIFSGCQTTPTITITDEPKAEVESELIDLGVYKAVTQANEVETVEKVIIQRTIPDIKEWTIEELDYYIDRQEIQIRSTEENVKGQHLNLEMLKIIRENVRKKAEKVKLKPKGGKGT